MLVDENRLSKIGRMAAQKNDWGTVFTCAQGLISRNNLNPEGFFFLGLAEKAARQPLKSINAFEKCLSASNQKIYYNGDITSVDEFNEMKKRFPSIDHWMIGRGLITDPFLPAMIKNNTKAYPENRVEVFSHFIQELFEGYASALSGKSHVLTKMTSYWEYFAKTFPDPHKTFKRIKKAKTIEAYEEAVKVNLDGLSQF